MLGRGGDPLFGADDVGDAHEVVVDDVGEMVGGKAVRLHQHLIVDIRVLEGDVAAEFVAKRSGGGLVARMWWDLHADDIGPAFGEVGVDLRLREFAVGSVVAWRELRGDLALLQNLSSSAVSNER